MSSWARSTPWKMLTSDDRQEREGDDRCSRRRRVQPGSRRRMRSWLLLGALFPGELLGIGRG